MADRMTKNVFDWEHFLVYLSGPIDYADNPHGWRDEWTSKLINMGIEKHHILNPCHKPISNSNFNFDNEAQITRKFREEGDWKNWNNAMQQIMHCDLRLCDKSDLILVNFPKIGTNDFYRQILTEKNELMSQLDDLLTCSSILSRNAILELGKLVEKCANKYSSMRVPTYGTIHEIVTSRLQRKPVYMVWEGEGTKDCSGWLMRLVGHRNIFAHIDDLIAHLDSIRRGKTAFDANEWLLLDYDK